MKETKKLLEIKKILITMGLSTCLATTLTGCTKKREMTFVEYLDAKYDDTYDYFNGDENLKVIRIKDFNGNESYHLARRIPGLISKDNVLNIEITDFDKYDKFRKIAPNNSDIAFYFDELDNSLLTVKFSITNLLNVHEKNITYAINDIISEDDAYKCAVANIGTKDIYTNDELKDMLTSLNNKNIKQITK